MSVIKSCVDSKKGRYVETVSRPVVETAWEVYGHVKRANSIYPTNQHEAQLRIDEFILANAKLWDLSGRIGVAHEVYHFSDTDLDEMAKLLESEKNLIKEMISSDRKRYRNLPGDSPMTVEKIQLQFARKAVMLLEELTDFVLKKKQPPKNLVP